MEGDHEPVFRDIPGFCKVSFQGKVLIVFDKAVKDETGNIMRGAIPCKHRDEDARLTDGPLHQGISIGRLMICHRLLF